MVKNHHANDNSGFSLWIGKIPWRRKWQPTPVFLPGESHGKRSLVGYIPWVCKESDMTYQLNNNSIVRPTDQETATNEKRICHPWLPRGRAAMLPRAQGKHQEAGGGGTQKGVFTVASGVRKCRQAQDWPVRITSVDSGCKGWPWISGPSLGATRVEGIVILSVRPPWRRWSGCRWWADILYLKAVLPDQLVTFSSNSLTLGQVSKTADIKSLEYKK